MCGVNSPGEFDGVVDTVVVHTLTEEMHGSDGSVHPLVLPGCKNVFKRES